MAKKVTGSAVTKVAGKVSVDDFTASVFAGVMRAQDARKIKYPGKIIYGIIWDPNFGPGGPITGPGGGFLNG